MTTLKLIATVAFLALLAGCENPADPSLGQLEQAWSQGGGGAMPDLLRGHEDLVRVGITHANQLVVAAGYTNNPELFPPVAPGTSGDSTNHQLVLGSWETDFPGPRILAFYEDSGNGWADNPMLQNLHFLRNFTGENTVEERSDACVGSRKRIIAATKHAVELWQSGNLTDAEYFLGHALHIIQDSFAPAHTIRDGTGLRHLTDICYYSMSSIDGVCAHGWPASVNGDTVWMNTWACRLNPWDRGADCMKPEALAASWASAGYLRAVTPLLLGKSNDFTGLLNAYFDVPTDNFAGYHSCEGGPTPGDDGCDAMMARARAVIGFGYWQDHARWTTGTPTENDCEGTCPDCSTYGYDGSGKRVECDQPDQELCYGSDAPGFIAKVWQLKDVPKTLEDDYAKGKSSNRVDVGDFRYNHTTPGTKVIDRSELKAGDALVRDESSNDSHIVLWEREGDKKGDDCVYECRGCNYGCGYWCRSFDDSYIPIRFEGTCAAKPCANTCNKHGTRAENGSCKCFEGFAGDNCEKCAEGYSNYPYCQRNGSQCTATRKLECGQTVSGDTWSGSNSMFEYPFCVNWSESGPEVVYELRASDSRFGLATIEITKGSGATDEEVNVDLFSLDGRCDKNQCKEYGDKTLLTWFAPKDVQYIVVDSLEGDSGAYTLEVKCTFTDDSGPWIGDACKSDSDCDFTDPDAGQAGFCYKDRGASFCSLPCEGYCPGKSGKASAFCIEDPKQKGKGICVSKAEELNDCCGNILNTSPREKPRFNSKKGQAWVCVPPKESEK